MVSAAMILSQIPAFRQRTPAVYEPKLLARSRHDAPECNTQTMPLRIRR
jgi:hypothetical protein